MAENASEQQLPIVPMHPDCPFYDKDPGEVQRVLEDIFERYLQTRKTHLTYGEIEDLTNLIKNVSTTLVTQHGSECPMGRMVYEVSKDLERMKGASEGRDQTVTNWSNVSQILVTVLAGIAILMSFISLFLK